MNLHMYRRHYLFCQILYYCDPSKCLLIGHGILYSIIQHIVYILDNLGPVQRWLPLRQLDRFKIIVSLSRFSICRTLGLMDINVYCTSKTVMFWWTHGEPKVARSVTGCSLLVVNCLLIDVKKLTQRIKNLKKSRFYGKNKKPLKMLNKKRC